ncbi:MAG: hypothetical protein Q9N67_11590 [Ghiorsea sp.]|nr:hypothetical protein [Ghiorsea sp.]
MSIAILRTAKLKTLGNIAGSAAHVSRSRDTPNADPVIDNITLVGSGDIFLDVKNMLPGKVSEECSSCR